MVVFCGPSIKKDDALRCLDCRVLAPAAQGDIYKAAKERPSAIGLIDGYFETRPSVWHKEILWAMQQGVHVFGASSMGALRAAELAPFGMVGVGQIYKAYQEGWIEDDDEVTVTHGPAELNYPALSEAMVNIRATVSRAVLEEVISAEFSRQLLAIAKGLHYKGRSFPKIMTLLRDSLPATSEVNSLVEWLPSGRVDQKKLDAMEMLRAMRKMASSGHTPMDVTFAFESTIAWRAAIRKAERQGPGFYGQDGY
ncbi:MAG: TfuA-like protein [Alphaproteobacteria bacterium]